MFKPCPMNPKQDVAAGPPVRETDIDTGTQEGYCFVLLWERQRGTERGKGKCAQGERNQTCDCVCANTLLCVAV